MASICVYSHKRQVAHGYIFPVEKIKASYLKGAKLKIEFGFTIREVTVLIGALFK